MVRKVLFLIIGIITSIFMMGKVYAADVYQTLTITEGQYPNVKFYPETLHVNTGDNLHLTIKNTRQGGYTRIFMPSINLDQEIAPDNVAQIDICLSNPTSKTMWFQISSLDGKKIPGYIVTRDFQVPIVNVPSRLLDVSALNDIVNYSKDYCYLEKEPPTYKKSPARYPVRGYW